MRLSKTMKALFALVMLIFCGVICWYAIGTSSLAAQKAELEQKLETSLGRERKQQAEYDAVMEELPVITAELDALQPEADAAKAQADILKAERKQLRADVAELKEKLEGAEEPTPALHTIQVRLTETSDALQNALEQISAIRAETETVLKLLKGNSPSH